MLSCWTSQKYYCLVPILSKTDIIINPFPDNKILDSSKLKEFTDDNFRFDENSVKFSERVENTLEQFLLFPQCFQKTCSTNT